MSEEMILSPSPRECFNKEVCIGCKDFVQNNGLCAGSTDDVVKCVEIRKARNIIPYKNPCPKCNPGKGPKRAPTEVV